MAFNSFLNISDANALLTAIKTELDTQWEMLYDGTASSLGSNRTVIMRIKSGLNSNGLLPDPNEEYFILVFEKVDNYVRMRLAKSATNAGVITGYTPTPMAEIYGKINPITYPCSMLITYTNENVGILVESGINTAGTFACSLFTTLPSPSGDEEKNNAFVMSHVNDPQKVWALDGGTFYSAGEYDLFIPVVQTGPNLQAASYVLYPIAAHITGGNNLIGFLFEIYKTGDDTILKNTDILFTGSSNYRLMKATGAENFIVIREGSI